MAVTNLAKQIETLLPMQLVEFMESAGLVAGKLGWRLYLVGGTVRDLLLKRPNYDIDLVVEGDAVVLGKRLAEAKNAKITVHPRFGTVKLQWQGWPIDIATARTETYAAPGALPDPKPASLAEDLIRRDFTVNAMAVELFSGRWGQVIDLYGGQKDAKQKLIRILHDNSFVDDATRIWRAVRYEQRLDFTVEPATLRLLKRDIDYLDTISGDRIRRELELVFQESVPEQMLRRAGGLGLLSRINKNLKGDELRVDGFLAAREYYYPEQPPLPVYLGTLTYPLTTKQIADIVSFLRLPKTESAIVSDVAGLKSKTTRLQKPGLKRSAIYHLLDSYAPEAVEVNLFCSDSRQVTKYLSLFLNKLRYVKAETTGRELLKLGIPAGPWVKEILERLSDARLDGKVRSKKGEQELARHWLV